MYSKKMFSFIRNCLPKGLYHFALPPVMNESFCRSSSWPAFGNANVLECCRSNTYVMVSHGCFNLQVCNNI